MIGEEVRRSEEYVQSGMKNDKNKNANFEKEFT